MIVHFATAPMERSKSQVITDVLFSLCSLYSRNNDKLSQLYRHCLNILGSHVTPSVTADEFRLSQRIQKLLVKRNRERDALTFTELHQKLCNQRVLCSRQAVLLFLLTLGDDLSHLYTSSSQDSLLLGLPSLGGSVVSPSDSRLHQECGGGGKGGGPMMGVSAAESSGIGSMQGTVGASGAGHASSSSLHSLPNRPFNTSSQATFVGAPPFTPYASTPAMGVGLGAGRPEQPRPPTLGSAREATWSEIRPGHSTVPPSAADSAKLTEEVPEAVLLRDILFVFQGIEGEVIRYQGKEEGYRIDEKYCVSPSVRVLCHKLAELGWLFRKIRMYIDSKSRDKTIGLVGQSFCSALSQELTEYYRLLAVLEAQQLRDAAARACACGSSADQPQQRQNIVAMGTGTLTLRRLVVWTHTPLERLKVLAILVDGCKRLKGGALISSLYAYSRHGDPYVHSLVIHLLNWVFRPLNSMLNSWIFDGELCDVFFEFFVAADASVSQQKLWTAKYSLRHSMLPSFIPTDVAQKILVIGKSINFLRERCQDYTQLGGTAMRSWYLCEDGEPTFDSMTGPPLHSVVEEAYLETSKQLLHVLNTKYHFMEHLKALRRYLLLGQGDFIRYLMDLLEPELSKPAVSLYLHNLTGTLESAVRATNAQFEAAEILQRLDVRLLELSPGDKGWDVFSLHYHVDGPISTVFTTDAMLKYLRVFNFLWRAKRVEYCLASVWRDMTSNCRYFRALTELQPVLHLCQLLTSSMIHFISQLQYYVTFEVMECCWAGLTKQVGGARDMDQVIDAHNKFLQKTISQCLLDPDSQHMLTQLRAIFDLITEFQQKLRLVFVECLKETERRKSVEEMSEQRGEMGVWGTTAIEADQEKEKVRLFATKNVPNYRSQFTVLQQSYEDMLKEFLVKLNEHPEQNLQFLCFRLDFNEHYTPS